MASGGPKFYDAIKEQHRTFIDDMWGKIGELKLQIGELKLRNDITQTQVIDQLGSESLEIRLGGIYSLERTALENRDYHWPIIVLLATYVRTHARE